MEKMFRKTLVTLFSLVCVCSYAREAADIHDGFDSLGGVTELLAVRCISQDASGMIWIGTDKCLYSYDGYELRPYPGGLGNVHINCIVSKEESLYIGCNDGFLCFDTTKGTYANIEYFDSDAVRSIISIDDILYIGAESGLYRYDCSGQETSRSIQRIMSGVILSLAANDDRIFVGTMQGIGVYDIRKNAYKDLEIDSFADRNARFIVPALLSENDSTLWIGTSSSVIRSDPRSGKSETVANVPVAKSIFRTSDDIIFIGTDNGLLMLDLNDRTVSTVKEGAVWHDFEDRDGSIWFATDSGILLYKQSKAIRSSDTGMMPDNGLFTSLYKDSKGRLWATSTHGILMYEGFGATPIHYSMRAPVHSIPHNKTKKVVEDRPTGTILVATDTGYLTFNEHTGEFEQHSIEGTYNWFYDILLDGKNMWLASYEGLFCLVEGSVTERYTTSEGLSTNDVAQIAKDRSGRIWILTRDQNVFIADRRSGSVEQFPIEGKSGSRYADNLINDKEGNIWISAGSLVMRINDELAVNRIVQLDATNTMEIHSLNEGIDRVWACTSEGVYIIEKEGSHIDHINTGRQYACMAHDEENGRIVLGGLGDIVSFAVEDLGKLTGGDDRPICITKVLVNGTDVVDREQIEKGIITLANNRNNVTISFSDFNYDKEVPGRFHYTLTSRKGNWSEVISNNTIALPQLKSGRHKLYVSTSSIKENDKETLTIRIRPPVSLSLPMILFYLLLLSALGSWILRYFNIKKGLALEVQQRDSILEQSRQKEAFFGNVAHEFKTPLSLIIAPLGKLIKETDDPKALQTLQVAQENAMKLSSLIHNTIDYYGQNNVTANDLIISEVEFVEFARTVFSTFKENYPEKEFIFDSSQSEIVTEVDVIKMEMVLNNLLSNACKYTPDGGSVIMTIERDNALNRLVLKVSDTGIGIPQEELPLVFQRYFESSRSKGGNYDSTGIGLSVIKKYVESHGGTVSADSDDNGTTFIVTIPCKSGSSTFRKTDRSVLSDNEDTPLIVVVDDNVQICSFLESMLKGKYRCISTNNGKSGLKLCKDVMPDLIISDVLMPVMDGLEMCKNIRDYAPLATIPIILLTAKGDKDTEVKSIELGIDSFVPKPFEFETLVAKIDQLIGNSKRMEQKIRLEMISKPAEQVELSYDEKYLQKVTQLIEEHIDDSDLSVKKLCDLGRFNEKQMYRKIKQLTGLSTVEYVRAIRLKKAALLLQNGNFTVSEVMYSVGFSNASYFTRAFSAEYGKTPSEYMKSYKK